MKRLSIILVVFSFVLLPSLRADIRLGVKAGVNLANPSFNLNSIQTSNFTGYQAGPILEFALPVIGLGMDVAVLYSQQGLKFQFNDLNFNERQSALDVPVNLKYKFELLKDFGAYLTAGPYISFKLSGNSFSLTDITENIQNDFKNESFGAGINLGAGFELLKHWQVGANYRISLTNDYKSLNTESFDLKGKDRIWSITAAYFF